MSAKDIFHNTVRSALEKDGWTITHDPLFLKVTSQVKIKIDLGAEKLLAAEKGIHKIVVEVKSFLGGRRCQNSIRLLVNFLIIE